MPKIHRNQGRRRWRDLAFTCWIWASSLWAAPVLAQSLDSVTPDVVERGQELTLTLDGADLETTTDVTISGERVLVLDFAASADQVLVDILVGQRAVADTRTITLTLEGDVTVATSFDVVPGDVVLFGLDPDAVVRGEGESVAIDGLNLDDIESVSLGPNITITQPDVDDDDPTQATTTITPSDLAVAGEHDLVAEGSQVTDTLPGALTVVPGALSIDAVTPDEAERGDSLMLTLTGENLDVIEEVRLGSGVHVDGTTLIDPTEMEVDVSVLDESLPIDAARDLVLVTAEGNVTVEDAFTVTGGQPIIDVVRPDRVTQGSSIEVTLEGRNLDGVESLTAGPGITVDELESVSPVQVLAQLTVADDAEVGLRDVTVEGALGEATAEAGLQVLARILPPVDVNFPDVVDIGRVELGARKQVSLLFVNGNNVEETISLEITSGDVSEFSFINADGTTLEERTTHAVTFEVPALGETLILAEYRPGVQSVSTATATVRARDEVIGGLSLRGTGLATVLSFSPDPPVTIPPFVEGEVGFRQVSTISTTTDQTVIEGYELLVERNDSAYAEGFDQTDVLFSEPVPPEEEQIFGSTLLTLQTSYPAGTYEGELWVLTNRPTAPIVPLVFFTQVSPAPEDDPADAPGDEPGDVGPDAGDTGFDRGDDDRPDVSETDAAGDSGSDGAAESSQPPPEEGCCSQSRGRGPVEPLLLSGVVWWWLRRRSPVAQR